MESSSDTETLNILDNKDIIKVLKRNTADEDVMFESEATEDPEETEVEEIIEIIEEIEVEENDENDESNELLPDNDTSLSKSKASTNINFKNKGLTKNEKNSHKNDENNRKDIEIYGSDEENSMFTSQHTKEETTKAISNSSRKNSHKQIITYDADEDWEDEEMEHLEVLDDNSEFTDDNQTEALQSNHKNDKKFKNSQTIPLQTDRLDSKTHIDSTMKSEKSRTDNYITNNINNIEDDIEDTTHEIVKNVENNLLYTVLGTKKQDSSVKQTQQEKLNNAQYIKMERLDENTIPVEGTIYYEGDNMDMLYVAQAIDGNEQYQYDNATVEQEEPMWETVNDDTNQNQEEDSSQDQIFLHEDEDGQLYFKDENGTLQPVYLTDDGNYAIAESNDDQESKESQSKSQQSKVTEEDNYILPDLDTKSIKQTTASTMSSSALQELDNEDNTVTISLIISEDEYGQKRTQVIIPTTDNSKCDICNKSFKTSFQLLRHNRLKHAREEDITTRNFPCDLCPKRYPDQTSLARHRKTHTGDRPFQCLECHKNFPTSTALRRHLALHNTQSRPLPCIYCGRRFMEKASLVKHEQSHMPNEQREHTCDICQKTFSHVTDLSMHKKYHDPEKKFDCEVCGREFNRLNNLQRHMMVHQRQQGGNEEILSCDVCGITYKFMSSLTRHMVTTHMNPEKLRQQAEEQRRKRENNYRKYLENRKMYETQHTTYDKKRNYHKNTRLLTRNNDDTA